MPSPFFRSAVFSLAFFAALAGCQCGEPGATCTTAQDCLSARPFCDEDQGLCVACVVNEQCNEGFVCLNGACEAGCANETDRCVAGKFCKPGVGCVECASDAQCGPGKVCSNEGCVPGCSAQNPTCPSGLVCDATAGRCVECVDAAQCTQAPLTVCNPATQTCVQCTTSADCRDASKPVCDTSTNTCVGCVANGDCASGVCHMQRCVQCTSDAQCSGTTPRCNTTTNTCVACVPGATDNCPLGQYCRADNRCEQGCKTGTDCPSGVCLADHSCQACTADAQCAAGKVCQNGTCVGACGAASPCGSGQACCNGRCENLQNDAANCGACGVQCAGGSACCGASCKPLNSLTDCGACGNRCGVDQFCDGTVCRNQVFPEFCANKNVVAIRDGVPLDNAATGILASTIQQYCSSQTVLTYGDDTDPALVDQDAGTLLLGGGSTVVTAGGPFPNLPVKWLERTRKATKVYFSNNLQGTEFYFKQRLPSDAGVADPILVTKVQSSCTAQPDGGLGGEHSDIFLVELVTDPASGTLALVAYGLCSPGAGTQAGAWYWANVILPNRTQYTDSWYIYEWTDTNGNTTPDALDSWSRLASGR